jgi:hypothetical protein
MSISASVQHGQVGRRRRRFQFLHEAHIDAGFAAMGEQHLAVRILAHRRDEPAIDAKPGKVLGNIACDPARTYVHRTRIRIPQAQRLVGYAVDIDVGATYDTYPWGKTEVHPCRTCRYRAHSIPQSVRF